MEERLEENIVELPLIDMPSFEVKRVLKKFMPMIILLTAVITALVAVFGFWNTFTVKLYYVDHVELFQYKHDRHLLTNGGNSVIQGQPASATVFLDICSQVYGTAQVQNEIYKKVVEKSSLKDLAETELFKMIKIVDLSQRSMFSVRVQGKAKQEELAYILDSVLNVMEPKLVVKFNETMSFIQTLNPELNRIKISDSKEIKLDTTLQRAVYSDVIIQTVISFILSAVVLIFLVLMFDNFNGRVKKNGKFFDALRIPIIGSMPNACVEKEKIKSLPIPDSEVLK